MQPRAILLLRLVALSACLLAPWRVGAEQAKHCASCEEAYVGEWSPVVNGLRARLVIKPDVQWETRQKKAIDYATTHGMKRDPDPYAKDTFLLYLDLENLTDKGIWRKFGYSADECFTLNLTDGSGREAEEIPVTLLAPFMLPTWITIPGGSTLHLFVLFGRYSSGEDGMRFGAGHSLWKIDSDKSVRYYLSCTFSDAKPLTSPPKEASVWQGKLILPKVELPLRSE